MIGFIYKISVIDEFYIGSTINLNGRKAKHKQDSKTLNSLLYKKIRDNNYEFKMEVLHGFKCENETELRIEERRVCEELKPTLNMNRVIRSCEEDKEHKKQYYIDNAEKLKQYSNDYYKNNKDYYQAYYLNNVDRLKERIICECGCDVMKSKITRHKKSKKHINLMKCGVIEDKVL